VIRIVYVDPESQREVVADLDAERIRIGREGGNELVLPYMEVSRFHAEVSGSEHGVVLTDRSTNGTFVNGQRVFGKQVLQLGDRVTIGNCVLHVYTAEQVRQIQAGQVQQGQGAPLAYPAEMYQQPAYTPEAAAATGAMVAIPAGGQPSVDILQAKPAPRRGAAPVDLKRRVHRRLLQYMDLKSLDLNQVAEGELRTRARDLLIDIISELESDINPEIDRDLFIKEVLDEALGLGPLEDLLDDDTVTEIMVVRKDQIYVERDGRIEFTGCTFTSDDTVLAVIERIITPLGRRIDESCPLVDARLKDGSRVNAIIPPLAIKGPCITIRKFGKKSLTMSDLVDWGSVSEQIAGFLEKCVLGRKNIIISGGTGSGKTTLLNCLSAFIPSDERIVTIEDAAELRLPQEHVVSLETKPANLEGKGAYSIRELVKNSLRMRPDRIVVGECRGGEALDMLQAMNTGHDGSLTTGHANSPTDMISRLETMVLMSGMDLPVRAIRDQICAAVDVIVQQTRFSDGSRRVINVTEVVGLQDDGRIHLEDIFRFQQRGVDSRGKVHGEVLLTGYIPSFVPDLINAGIVSDGNFL